MFSEELEMFINYLEGLENLPRGREALEEFQSYLRECLIYVDAFETDELERVPAAR